MGLGFIGLGFMACVLRGYRRHYIQLMPIPFYSLCLYTSSMSNWYVFRAKLFAQSRLPKSSFKNTKTHCNSSERLASCASGRSTQVGPPKNVSTKVLT